MTAPDFVKHLRRGGYLVYGPGPWLARCPGCDPETNVAPTLSVGSVGGVIRLSCSEGCGVTDIVAGLGLRWEAVFPHGLRGGGHAVPIARAGGAR